MPAVVANVHAIRMLLRGHNSLAIGALMPCTFRNLFLLRALGRDSVLYSLKPTHVLSNFSAKLKQS